MGARQYRSREGQASTVDVKTQLTALGSEAAPGALLVPQGVTQLAGIMVASMSDFSATGSANTLVRLEGPGLPEGPEVVIAGAHGLAIATGGRSATTAIYIPLNVRVTTANEILIFGEMTGADIGLCSIGVTLVFK